MPTWLKVVGGCGCVLFLAVGVLLGALGLGARWLVGSGKQVPTTWIAGPGSSGAFHSDSIGVDPGLAEFVTQLFQEIGRIQREPARGALGRWDWLEALGSEGDPPDAEALGAWLPTDAALVIEVAEDGVELAGAFNLPRFGRLVRSLVKGATEASEPHGAYDVRCAEGDLFFGFVGGTLLLSNGRSSLERCFDRVDARRERGGEAADTALGGERMEGVAARADVYGVLRDRAALDATVGFLTRAEWFETQEFDWIPAELVDIGLGLDLSTRDELAGELVVTCPDAEVAQASLQALEQQIAQWSSRADEAELDLSAAAVQRGDRVETTFRLRGLRSTLEHLARYLAGS